MKSTEFVGITGRSVCDWHETNAFAEGSVFKDYLLENASSLRLKTSNAFFSICSDGT